MCTFYIIPNILLIRILPTNCIFLILVHTFTFICITACVLQCKILHNTAQFIIFTFLYSSMLVHNILTLCQTVKVSLFYEYLHNTSNFWNIISTKDSYNKNIEKTCFEYFNIYNLKDHLFKKQENFSLTTFCGSVVEKLELSSELNMLNMFIPNYPINMYVIIVYQNSK